MRFARPKPFRGGAAWPIGGERGPLVTWFEKPESGLRFVGLSHDIARREHMHRDYSDVQGYYLDSDCFDTVRPVVYMLTHGRYLSGGADPFNADSKTGRGPAWLSLDISTDIREAVRESHRLCERYAESEREYRDAYSAGALAGAAVREAESDRLEALTLCAEMRAAKQALKRGDMAPLAFENICNLARERVAEIREAIEAARDAREEARANWSYQAESFADGLASR